MSTLDPNASSPPSGAPYRDVLGNDPLAAPPPSPAPRRRRWLVGLAAVLGLGLLAKGVFFQGERGPGDAPPELTASSRTFPAGEADLGPSTPLAPLLVSDAPDRLAVLEPSEGAVSVNRGEPLVVRFNRPMVQGAAVGRPLAESPMVFNPPVRGTARWSSRSSLAFTAEPSVWDAGQQSALTLAPTLRSLAGEALDEGGERTVVFTGGARLRSDLSRRRVLPGDALRLVFEGRVEPASLASQLLVYEVGGGRRALSFSPSSGGQDEQGRTLIDLRLARTLEPGSQIGVAISPSLATSWAGETTPSIMSFELTPRPHIEGYSCPENTTEAESCEYSGPPGRIVDVAETLRVFSTTALGPVAPGAVQVSPALPNLAVSVQGQVLSVRGDWEPGQVYEVRFGELRSTEGQALARTAPLAVRSQGRPPEVQSATGRLTYERNAQGVIPFAAIHVDQGAIGYAPVAPGNELLAALESQRNPGARSGPSWSDLPLAPLVPTARANRWARGRFTWLDAAQGRASSMALVSFRAARPEDPSATSPASFVQSTDLGITAQNLDDGVLVWVTSLTTAAPVSGAELTLAGAVGQSLATGRTDARGLAFLSAPRRVRAAATALRAVHGDDRAVLVVDPRNAVRPDQLGLQTGEESAPTSAPVASVLTDRGAYRPGESLHAKVVVRTVHGDTLRPLRRGQVRLRLVSPGDGTYTESRARLGRFGTADANFQLSPNAPLGNHTLEVYRDGVSAPIGSATITVAEFRQPSMRVDVRSDAAPLHDGETLRSRISAAYLFGARAGGTRARWSLTREAGGPMPTRWDRYAFAPVDASTRTGTVESGELTLDPRGEGEVAVRVTQSAPVRERASLEVTVTDASGQTTTAWNNVATYPATWEVGVHRGPDWVEANTPLDLDAVVIAHDGAPAEGRPVQARILREGWHSYWEWSDHARDDSAGEAGGYQARRTQEAVVVHQCALTSGAEPVHCTFTPDRPGTYVLEASTRDDQGRTAIASRRLYVAGPHEHPDRDPPGAPIAVTPTRTNWFVGERASVAVESPWPDAEALVTVTREGVAYSERRRVVAGGNVFELPVTREMVPNAFVSVVLVRPRSGAPGAEVDLNAPDLRWGATELSVRAQSGPLNVSLALPTCTARPCSVRPGTDVPVEVTVRDGAEAGAVAEVALYAVDEGTLRLTSYTTPDPTAGLFPRRAPSFNFEDLRRTLVSRVDFPPLPGQSGDGDEDASGRLRDDRETFDPTPLWLPRLVTDASGHARAVFHVPNRPAEYRIMAVAVDSGVRSGRASTQLTATRPVVLRQAFPRFLTAGDRAEAAVFVHNTQDRAVDVQVTATIQGRARPPRTVHLEAGTDQRVAEPVEASGEAVSVRFEATVNGEGDSAESAIPVAPRGRWNRAQTVGSVRGSRDVTLALPTGALPGGEVTLAVANHPFVGFETSLADLEDAPWSGAEPLAAQVLALASLADLHADVRPGDRRAERARARAEAALSRLAALQTYTGGFAPWSQSGDAQPYLTAYAVHAIETARRHRWTLPAGMRDRALEYLASLARYTSFLDADPSRGHDDLAFALRVLQDAGRGDAGRVTAVYNQRERLTPYGLAQLALAMPVSDRRRDALVLSAERAVLATRRDERRTPSILRWYDTSTRTLGAVLEAACRVDVGYPSARLLASQILRQREDGGGAAWGSTHETSHALAALASYAYRFQSAGELEATVSLDGAALTPRARTRDMAWYTLPFDRVSSGSHRVTVQSGGSAYYALGGRWAVALGEADRVARGRTATLHRVFETEAGAPLGENAHVRLGDLVRVRLYLYDEHQPPPYLAVRDPLGGGFEAVDATLDTSPRDSLLAILGMGPDDTAVDPRGFHAMRSLDVISHRAFERGFTTYYLSSPRAGLVELTYAVRATAVGSFTLPPAQVEALYRPRYLARSAMNTLVVDP